MKTAQPASLPPGPRSSAGISRATAASIKAASSEVKNIHGPGRTGTGGLAVPASQGMPPLKMRARATAVPEKRNAVAEVSRTRRDGVATAGFMTALSCFTGLTHRLHEAFSASSQHRGFRPQGYLA